MKLAEVNMNIIRVEKKLSVTYILISLITGKCKTIPVHAWTGPGGFQGFEDSRFTDNPYINVVKLSAQDVGRLYPQEIYLILIFV